MLEKAEQGIWPSFAPLSYRNVAGPDGKKIIAVRRQLTTSSSASPWSPAFFRQA
jgi:hypothetical protein